MATIKYRLELVLSSEFEVDESELQYGMETLLDNVLEYIDESDQHYVTRTDPDSYEWKIVELYRDDEPIPC